MMRRFLRRLMWLAGRVIAGWLDFDEPKPQSPPPARPARSIRRCN
jgi:hypothetical protein